MEFNGPGRLANWIFLEKISAARACAWSGVFNGEETWCGLREKSGKTGYVDGIKRRQGVFAVFSTSLWNRQVVHTLYTIQARCYMDRVSAR